MGSFHLVKQVGSSHYWRSYSQRGCGSMELIKWSARGKLPVIHSSFNLFTGAGGGKNNKTYPSSSSSKLLTSSAATAGKMMLTNITFHCSTPKPILFQTRYLHDVNPPKQGWFYNLLGISRFKNKYMETVPFTKRTRFIPFSLDWDREMNLFFRGYVLETNFVLKTILEARRNKLHPQNKQYDLKVFLDTHPQSIRLKWILHDIVDALGKNMDMKQDVNATTDHLQGLRWQIFIIDHPDVSAFRIPGGIIFVYRGLLQHFSSDGELAMIIGHEVGRIVARHHFERVINKIHYAMIKLISFFPFNLIPVVDITSKIQQLLRVLDFYPQLHEMEADCIGLMLISSAGYDPRIAPKVIEKFSQLKAPSSPTTNPVVKKLAKCHPSSETRAHLLNQFMGQALNIHDQVEAGHWIRPRRFGGLHLIKKV